MSSCDLIPQHPEDEKKEKEPLLRVAPRVGVPICLPTVNLTECMTSSSLCLNSYEDRFQKWQAEATVAPCTMGKGGGKGCTSRKGGKRQRVDSSSDKKTSTEASATSTSLGKQKENLCPENEFVCCGVTIDNAYDNNKPVFSGVPLVHDGDEDHVIVEGDSDCNNVTVNHVHPEHLLTGIISHSNWEKLHHLDFNILLGFITLISVYQFLHRTDETNCCHSFVFLQLLSMSVVFLI